MPQAVQIYVGSFTTDITAENLEEHFNLFSFGEILDSKVIYNQNGESQCFGFVTIAFEDDADIDAAVDQANSTDLQGNCLEVRRAADGEQDQAEQDAMNQGDGETVEIIESEEIVEEEE
ncbi:hypothetical protein TWF694_005354 [Orbilia ellipsospora]|uniref:RRM domain-containing protein n=1 Tax=Orbilia ellipsospora TaxID=2528407 RepID=A0AAV9WSW8_9PEZI